MTDIIDSREVVADSVETTQTLHDGRQSQMHTMMPGTIISYNPATMTCVVQPAIQAMHTLPDGTVEPMTITKLHDVPVHFPGGGGFTLHFPVAAGDDCMIVFAERSIDHWFQLGGVQKPNDWRMHDMSDAFVQVGVRSQPKVPGGSANRTRAAGPTFSPTTVQMRSDDATMMIEFDPGQKTMRMICPTQIVLDTPLVTVTGVIDVTNTKGGGNVGTFNGTLAVTQDVIANTVSLVHHLTSGVQPGGGDSGPPVPGT